MKNTFLVPSFFFMIGCTKEENLKGNNNNIEQPTDSIYPKNIDFTVIRANTLASAYNGKEWIGYIINDDNTWATYYNDGFLSYLIQVSILTLVIFPLLRFLIV